VTERHASGHTELAETDGGAYQSLRQRLAARAADRYALGKRLRKWVPRRALADWEPPTGRPDPIHQIMVSHEGRSASETAGPLQGRVARSAKQARNRTSDRPLPRFTREVGVGSKLFPSKARLAIRSE
jgi:hypothetical protein